MVLNQRLLDNSKNLIFLDWTNDVCCLGNNKALEDVSKKYPLKTLCRTYPSRKIRFIKKL